jgi:Zn-finger nucleic acid-binding protein
MANCVNCSAPLPADAITCAYFGSRNDVDLKGVHAYTTAVPLSQRTCPRCSLPLKTVDLKLDGTFYIERCDTCLGLFFDPGELETLLDKSVRNVHTIDRGRLNALTAVRRSDDYGVSYIKCPECGTLMNRTTLGAKSGVIVDRCKQHGIWLDGGELRQLLEWTKAGGKLLEQQRREERQKEEADRQKLQAMGTAPPGRLGEAAADEDPFGSILRGSEEPDLLGTLVKVVRFLTK